MNVEGPKKAMSDELHEQGKKLAVMLRDDWNAYIADVGPNPHADGFTDEQELICNGTQLLVKLILLNAKELPTLGQVETALFAAYKDIEAETISKSLN